MTGAGVLEEDKLFATLDPTTRTLKLDSGQEILLTDTVGFIRKLPHHLIQAFRSTLEEAKYADMIIHVVDASNPQMDIHMHVVYETLNQLEVGDKPVITLFNKTDRLCEGSDRIFKDFRAEKTLAISAKNKMGLDEVKDTIEELLRQSKILIERVFDYKRAGDIAVIRKYGQLLEEEYRAEGIFVRAYVPKDVYAQLEF